MTLRLNGSTSGYIEIDAPAVAGTRTLVLPTDSIQPGTVLVNKTDFTSVSSISINNCFTSTYDNYLIYIKSTLASGNTNLSLRLRLAGTDATTNCSWQRLYASGTTVAGSAASSQSELNFGWTSTTVSSAVATLFNPAVAAASTLQSGTWDVTNGIGNYSGIHTTATAYDGMTLLVPSSTITGTIRIYGLRNS
jgi:hypothetical protein